MQQKHTLEIDPDLFPGYEPIGFRQVEYGEKYYTGYAVQTWASQIKSNVFYIILKPLPPPWEPPAFLKPGWLTKSKGHAGWIWTEERPTLSKSHEDVWIPKIPTWYWIRGYIDTSDWPDVSGEEAIFECKGEQ